MEQIFIANGTSSSFMSGTVKWLYWQKYHIRIRELQHYDGGEMASTLMEETHEANPDFKA